MRAFRAFLTLAAAFETDFFRALTAWSAFVAPDVAAATVAVAEVTCACAPVTADCWVGQAAGDGRSSRVAAVTVPV